MSAASPGSRPALREAGAHFARPRRREEDELVPALRCLREPTEHPEHVRSDPVRGWDSGVTSMTIRTD